MKSKKKINWEKITKNEVFVARFKLISLFVLGFLIGVMFKSQASRTMVIGYDDHQILKSDEIQLGEEILEANEDNFE